MKYIVVSNPLSGSFDNKKILILVKRLKKEGIDIDDYRLKNDEMIDDFIVGLDRTEQYSLVFACGDGTINNAVNAIVKNAFDNIKITVLPMGTANVLANELKINNYRDTIRAIKNNKVSKISLFKVKGKKSKLCVLMASVGVDSITVCTINENLKKKIGKTAYLVSLLKNITKSNKVRLLTTVDGIKYKNVLTCICNGKYYGGKFKIAQNDLPRDDFDVLIIKKFRLFSFLKYYLTGKSRDIMLIRAKNVRIIGENEIYPLETDGDHFCFTPVEISAGEKWIDVIC
jgi:diacylglycerol kinase family enzyme